MDNAQRKTAIRNGFKAIGEGDAEPLLGLLDEQVQWTIIGNTRFSGKIGRASCRERVCLAV